MRIKNNSFANMKVLRGFSKLGTFAILQCFTGLPPLASSLLLGASGLLASAAAAAAAAG